jgi:CTP:molybdopterin cytidylyltransferase MocA
MIAVAIVLAAGSGVRLGGRKSRLVVDGEALVLRHVRRFSEVGARTVVVAHLDDVEWLSGVSLAVLSREPQQSGSLAIGVRALPADAELVLITPVDALPASTKTIEALLSAFAATPNFQSKRGHPVAVRRSTLSAYGGLAPPPLRDWLAELGSARIEISVDDPNVVTDLDDAERVLAATGALPRFT